MTWRKFTIEDPQILGDAVPSFITGASWRLKFLFIFSNTSSSAELEICTVGKEAVWFMFGAALSLLKFMHGSSQSSLWQRAAEGSWFIYRWNMSDAWGPRHRYCVATVAYSCSILSHNWLDISQENTTSAASVTHRQKSVMSSVLFYTCYQ